MVVSLVLLLPSPRVLCVLTPATTRKDGSRAAIRIVGLAVAGQPLLKVKTHKTRTYRRVVIVEGFVFVVMAGVSGGFVGLKCGRQRFGLMLLFV